MKLLNFSDETVLHKYEELAELKGLFELHTNEKKLTAAEVLNGGFDIIELAEGEFAQFLPSIPALSIVISRLVVADTILKIGKVLKPFNLLADSVYRTISEKVPSLKISEPAVIIGEYDFVLSMSYKLAQSGFLKVIIALEDIEQGKKIKNLIQGFVFNMQIQLISLDELTQLDSSNGLLIINFEKEKNPEIHESLTYFNFLSPNAVFVDLKSRKEPSLIEEARRAELIVVEEVEILKTKYAYLLDLFKNPSFV
ncbi:MAG: hypothetical protein WA160_14210 [Pseudobdellovibrio sp.]